MGRPNTRERITCGYRHVDITTCKHNTGTLLELSVRYLFGGGGGAGSGDQMSLLDHRPQFL